ncbi:response regulator [Patescibacteria group bacterium]|nr:response regulator [Patescibacteria group bacterium]
MKILVIDDNQNFREFLSELIGFYSADADVVLAEDGVRGLQIFSSDPASFDIVFTDRQMPGMLGEEVVREIKKLSPQTRVVLISGDCQEEVLQVAKTAGADKILFKPFKNEEFRQVLSF